MTPATASVPFVSRPRTKAATGDVAVAVVSDDPRLTGAFAARIAAAPGLRFGLPESDPPVLLVDERREDAAAVVRRFVPGPRRACLVLSDGSAPARTVALLRAGADGCVDAEASIATLTMAVLAGVHGVAQLPRGIARALVEAPGLPVAPEADEPVPAAVIEDLIRHRRFDIVFQPIEDLHTGKLVALEALARFRGDVERGPDAWLQLAERVGLRVELEHALLRATLEVAEAAPAEVLLAVNLSAAAAVHPDLAATVELFGPRRLVVEITDHGDLEDYGPLAAALAGLRRRGLRLAVDDSGRGLGSLHRIAGLAPSFMKLNRELTRDLHEDATKRAVASVILSFAGRIGSTVIAEGLETEDEADALRSLGVRLGQGHVVSRPLPLEDLGLAGDPAPAPEERTRPDAAISLPARVHARFLGACQHAVHVLSSLHPEATLGVAHLDYSDGRHTVVAVDGPLEALGLVTGASTPIEDTLCHHMVAGEAEPLCGDVAAHPVYGPLPVAEHLGLGSFAGAPLELGGGTRVGTLFAVAPHRDAFSEEDLRVIQDTAEALVGVLLVETAGMSRWEVVAHVRRLSRLDSLTGVLNGPAFEQAVAEQVDASPSDQRRAWYLALSLDDLPAVRAAHGHMVGDLVVKGVADALRACTSETDVVGRVAEDRFGVVLTGREQPQAVALVMDALEVALGEFVASRGVAFGVLGNTARLGALPPGADRWAAALGAPRRLL